MRNLSLPLVALLLAAVAPSAASAQSFEYPIEIEDLRVGLPPGRFGAEQDATTQRAVNVVKRSTWAPIYIDILVKKELTVGAKLRIESLDGDELRTTMEVPLTPSFNGVLPGARLKAADFGYTPYVRPGDRTGDVRVTIVSTDGKDTTLARTFTTRSLPYRDASNYVVLSLGSKLPGFDLPGGNAGAAGSTRRALRGGRVEAAAITSVAEMPDQWFGYQAADLVVLTTGSAAPQFLNDLFGDNAPETSRVRREALLEWVRRGGKLVVSVASNASTLVQYRQFQALLPAPLRADPPVRAVTALPIYATLPGTIVNDSLTAKTPGATFPVANLAAPTGRAPRTLIPPPDDRADGEAVPVVLQSAYGLGRVSLVTFDLDQSPFLDYPSRDQFWDWLLRECGSPKSALAPATNAAGNNFSNTSDNEDEWAAAIRRQVDTFDGVPVVSFGWVALFIILYTVVIGPVEYLVLKYVFKRLELTWITFPLIVVSVSAAAYFTAYAIKGNDLKINKVDVVDVDVAGGRVYGKTWFTIFSPRIDTYTIGVEPRDGWTVSRPGVPDPSPLVGWMGGGSSGGGSIVSRGYEYAPDPAGRAPAAGLSRVPIQVWSTKAFTANWSGTIDQGTPLIVADLYHPPGDPRKLTGSFVSNLPVETLADPYLIYAGKVYKLPAIQPGQRVDVPATGLPEDTNWFNSAASVSLQTKDSYQNSRFQQSAQPTVAITNLNIWGALFHERVLGSAKALSNASLRELDQSWRVEDSSKPKFFDEAILVASVSPPSGPAEGLMSDATGPSVTKLWLKGGLPGGTAARDPVPGSLRQETFLRVYIPIRPTAKKW